MGQSQSDGGDGNLARRRSSTQTAARFQMRSTDKAPVKLIMNKPKLQESKPILRVPHTNVKIMHVDPTERAGIVPGHGYIALQIVPPESRTTVGSNTASVLSPRLTPTQLALTPESARLGAAKGAVKRKLDSTTNSMLEEAALVDVGMDPRAAALLAQAKENYSEKEHKTIQREVRKWKAAFALTNNRPPNKKDIASNPFIFEQYYREKEFNAMKELLDQNKHAEAEAAAARQRERQQAANNLLRSVTDVEVARSEFNALEYLDLHRDVKKWKVAFKKNNGRPPSKKDVADAPDMYDKYYRLKELEAMKKLIADADALDRAHADELALAAEGDDVTSNRTVDPIENAKTQYDATEYATLSAEVKAWKVAFKQNRGRPPTKRDIAEDPEMFTKYYREKELEAMKKLIEDSEAVIIRRASMIGTVATIDQAKNDYNAAEHETLKQEVRAWKQGFKAQYGRAPTKRDISHDPDMFTKYYREKELDTMKQLAEEDASNGGAAFTTAPGELAIQRQNSGSFTSASSPVVMDGGAGSVDGDAMGTSDTNINNNKERRTSSLKGFGFAMQFAAKRRASRRTMSMVEFVEQPGNDNNEGGGQMPPPPGDGGSVADSAADASSPLGSTARMSDAPASHPSIHVDGSPKNSNFQTVSSLTLSDHGATKMLAATDNGGLTRERTEDFFNDGTRADALAAAGAGENGAADFGEMNTNNNGGAQSPNRHPPPPGSGSYSSKAPPPLSGFAMMEVSSPGKNSSGVSPTTSALGRDRVVVTQFVCPRGRQAVERVFFFDQALQLDKHAAAVLGLNSESGNYDPISEASKYDLEETEVYEMAGIRRPQTVTVVDDENDPLATYELQSNVLEALRMAIDAPMSDFAMGGSTYNDPGMQEFIDEALNEAHQLFDAQREEDEAYQRTYSVAQLTHAKSSRAGMGRRLASKKSKLMSVVRMRTTTFEEPEAAEGGGAAAAADDNDADDMYRGWAQEDLVRERKRLHKILNEYKAGFMERTGRAPEAFEMAQDPNIRDAFAQYHVLRKKSRVEQIQEAAVMHQQQNTTLEESDASPQRDQSSAPPPEYNNEEQSAQQHQTTYAPEVELDRMNEDAMRKQRLLAPIGGGEEEIIISPEQRELDLLNKEVKMWKRGFKEREGRNPTRRDIKNDPEFAEKYFRVKELEEMLGLGKKDGGADNAGGENVDESQQRVQSDDGESPARRHHNKYTPNSEEVTLGPTVGVADTDDAKEKIVVKRRTIPDTEEGWRDALGGIEDEEAINRRDAEADEDIAHRLLNSQALAHGLPSLRAEEEERDSTPARLRGQSDTTNNNTAANHRPQPTPTPVLHDEGGRASHGSPHPTVTTGWSFPMDQPDELSAVQQHTSRDASLNRGDSSVGVSGGGLSLDDKKARRKVVTKELNQWKAHFKMINGKAPTSKDMKQAPLIQQLFDEYTALGKEVDKEEAANKKSILKPALQRIPSPSETNNTHHHHNQPSPLDEDTYNNGEPGSPLTNAKQKRDRIANDIMQLRVDFKVHEGHAPTLKDISASPQMVAAYEEYNRANDFIIEHEGRPVTQAADVNEVVAQALRRKQLGRTLNEWKARFFDTFGRNPGVRDIKTDKTASGLFDDYNLIPKNMEEQATHMLEKAEEHEANDENVQFKEAKTRKKELNKILNEWKAGFQEQNGRKPKVADIIADPIISTVYSEYQELQAALADAKETQQQQHLGGGDGGGGFAPWGAPQTPQPPEFNGGGGEGADGPAPLPSESPAPQEERAPTPPHKAKKRVTKQLNQWKSEFAAREGRNPTKTDIKQDPEALALFQRYQELKSQLNAEGDEDDDEKKKENNNHNTSTADEVSPSGHREASEAAVSDADVHHHQEAPPPPPDAHNDAEQPTPAVVEEGQQQQQPNDKDESEQPPPQVSPEAELKAQKRNLNKRLNAWKRSFTDEHGRAPKQADIVQDPEMLSLYEELKVIKNEMKKYGDGGGDD